MFSASLLQSSVSHDLIIVFNVENSRSASYFRGKLFFSVLFKKKFKQIAFIRNGIFFINAFTVTFDQLNVSLMN